MAADEERAARIREQKDSHPGMTWSYIAEKVGVTERAAVAWAQTGGINYENAKALAELFDVDPDWLWRGVDRTQTPDPFERPSNGLDPRIDQLAAGLVDLADQVRGLDKFSHDSHAQVMNLRNTTLDSIERRLGAIEDKLDVMTSNQHALLDAAEQVREAFLRAAPPEEQDAREAGEIQWPDDQAPGQDTRETGT